MHVLKDDDKNTKIAWMHVEVELPGFPVIVQNRKAVNAAAFPLSINL